jgi:hypothetical protein
MSEFEYGVLFVEFLNTANVVFANYMALIFAGLTASWFLARRMTLAIAICFLALFTLGALSIGTGVFFAFADFFALQGHLLEQGSPTGALSWLGPLRTGGTAGLGVIQGMMASILVLSWAGTITFFWIVRASNPAPPGGDPA